MFKWFAKLFVKNKTTEETNLHIEELENELLKKTNLIEALEQCKVMLEDKVEIRDESIREFKAHINELIPTGTIALELIKDGVSEFKWVSKELSVVKSFKIKELMQDDGTEYLKLNMIILNAIQTIRDYFGKPITVTSGYRSEAYNKAVRGSSKSQHILGNAIDFKVKDVSPTVVNDFIKDNWQQLGVTGLEVGKSWTHIDCRNSNTLVVFK